MVFFVPAMSTRRLVTRTRRDRDVPFFKLSRPRRDVQPSRPQCRSLKTPTGEVCHLTNCFLRVRSIIFFVIYSHCMHVHKTKVTRPRRYIFKTKMRPRRWTLKTEMRPRRSTFKTEMRRDVPKNVSRPSRLSRLRRSRPRLHPCIVQAH